MDFITQIVSDNGFNFLEIKQCTSGITIYQPICDCCEYEYFLNYNSIINRDQYQYNDFLAFMDNEKFIDEIVVYDIGANVGMFSAHVMSQTPKCIIYAFEPVHVNIEAINKMQNKFYTMPPFGDYQILRLYRGAVSNFDGKQNFHFDSNGWSGVGRLVDGDTDKSFSANVVSIDSFASHEPAPHFIKIDTEGNELNVLEGAKETILKYKPTISMSAYHRPNDEEVLVAYLHNNYKFYNVEVIKRPFCENIIYANSVV